MKSKAAFMFKPEAGTFAPFPEVWSCTSISSKAAFTSFAQAGPRVTDTVGSIKFKKFVEED